MTSRSNRLRLRPFRNKKNTIIRGMVRQEIKIFCHRYRGTNHPLLISTFDDHRPHIKTDYKRVAKGIDQITGSPSKVIYLLKNVHFYRNKNKILKFFFFDSYSLVSKTIYIEIWRSRDRHDVILLLGLLDVNLMLFWNENFNLSLLSVSSELASSEIKMR